MNVGEYVRTKKGLIGKLKYTGFADADSTPYYIKTRKRIIWVNKCNVIKSSPQIIDLIEVGDFITYKQGNIYWDIFEQVSARYNRENQMTDLIVDNKPLNTVEILTVITHEQMEAMQYRVEE